MPGFRKIIFTALLAAAALNLYAQEKVVTKIDVLRGGEKWWGVFIGGDHRMPLTEPFTMIDMANITRQQTVPMLVSSRGRYIWSDEPFSIEFDGENIIIEASKKIEAVTGGRNLKEAYLVCVHENMPPDGKTPAMELFTAPVYDLVAELGYAPTADELRVTVRKILDAGYPGGTFVIPAGWQSMVGSFEVDGKRYPDFPGLLDEIHGKGFKVMLTITPHLSGDGADFVKLSGTGGVITDDSGEPVIARWAGGHSAIYDISTPEVFDEVRERLRVLKEDYGFDGFFFDCRDILPYMRHSAGGSSEYLEKWSMLSEDYDFTQYTISRGQGFSAYVTNMGGGREFNWEFLGRSLKDIISANLLGFPYVTASASTRGQSPEEYDPKLILRYMQMSAVMPVMNITFAPWSIEDPVVAQYCRELSQSRAMFADRYRDVIEESAQTAEPVIRHMEYVFPRTGFTDCDDQFMIGNNYLIAPVLTSDDSRTVRLPRGNWIDEDGKRYKGPLVTTVEARGNKIIYFELVK